MTKTLLFAAISLSFYGTSQSLTQANEPAIGELNSMFLCDSFATNYEGTVGNGVTWDYSTIGWYDQQYRDVEVVDPALTTYASDFATSTYAISVGGSIVTYYNSTAAERSSQGFVFSEPSLGDVIATFSSDEEIVATYPFAFGGALTDDFAGNLEYLSGNTAAANGTGYASVDGQGTLELPGAVSLTDVIRYKIVDTSWTTITFPIPLGDMEFIRTQYEYYDHAVSNLPIFVHSTIKVQNVDAPTPISEQSLVLSYYQPDGFTGVKETNLVDFEIYPNPTTSTVHISGTLSAHAEAIVVDQNGRTLLTTAAANGTVIDLSSFENGMYFIRIQDNDAVSTKSIVKK